MKYHFLFFTTISFLSCFGDNHSLQERQPKDSMSRAVVFDRAEDTLQSLMSKYGKSKALVALYFIDERFSDIISHRDTSKMLYCSIEGLLKRRVGEDDAALIEKINSNLSKTPLAARSQILKKLEQWLKNDILLSSVLGNNLDDQVFFEQLIFQIPETKGLLTIYLKSPQQYWGSLDVNQSCKLYYDVNLYLINLKPVERLNFFKKYFNAACNLSIDNVHSVRGDN